MTPRTYASPEAFKQALEQRLEGAPTFLRDRTCGLLGMQGFVGFTVGRAKDDQGERERRCVELCQQEGKAVVWE